MDEYMGAMDDPIAALEKTAAEILQRQEDEARAREEKEAELVRLEELATKKMAELDARAEQDGPQASRSLRVDGQHKSTIVMRQSDDGRYRAPNERGYDDQAKRDIATCDVAEKIRTLTQAGKGGVDADALPLAFESAVEEYQPNHLEFLLLANAYMQTAVSQNLALRAMVRRDPKAAARDAELSQRSSAETRRSIQQLHAMRSPSVHVGRADQLNVAHGPQQVNNVDGDTHVDDEPLSPADA